MILEPRKPGPLPVSPRLGAALTVLRTHYDVSAAAELDLDRVHEVESAFGLRLPDDLLAIYAAAIPPFVKRHKLTIGSVIAHTGALREHRARGDLVGIGQLEARAFLCLSKSDAEYPLLFDADDRTSVPFDLAAWIERQAHAVGDPATAEPLAARLVAFQPESTLSGKRVRHKIFGEGRALSETGTGPLRKVKCDFPGRGLKLLQARFLEFLD